MKKNIDYEWHLNHLLDSIELLSNEIEKKLPVFLEKKSLYCENCREVVNNKESSEQIYNIYHIYKNNFIKNLDMINEFTNKRLIKFCMKYNIQNIEKYNRKIEYIKLKNNTLIEKIKDNIELQKETELKKIENKDDINFNLKEIKRLNSIYLGIYYTYQNTVPESDYIFNFFFRLFPNILYRINFFTISNFDSIIFSVYENTINYFLFHAADSEIEKKFSENSLFYINYAFN